MSILASIARHTIESEDIQLHAYGIKVATVNAIEMHHGWVESKRNFRFRHVSLSSRMT